MRPIFGLTILTGALGAIAEAGDVYENAEVSHARLRQLRLATLIYLNDSSRVPPASPAALYPEYVSDPVVFWHPGDSDAAPTTIDNDLPDALDSARISFEFGALDESPHIDEPVIWDNSAQNNGGLFTSFLTSDGIIETTPPLATPRPTPVTLARAHLRRLVWASLVYAQDHRDLLPASLAQLWQSELFSTRSFWNPGDFDPLPEDITNSMPNAPNSARVSFDFPGASQWAWNLTPESVLLRDNDPANNEGYGRFEAMIGPTLRFVLDHEAGDSNEDCLIDLADWAEMASCLSNLSDEIEFPVCYVFDVDMDHRMMLSDAAWFQRVFAGPNAPLPNCEP